jgi:hypothetical protein
MPNGDHLVRDEARPLWMQVRSAEEDRARLRDKVHQLTRENNDLLKRLAVFKDALREIKREEDE